MKAIEVIAAQIPALHLNEHEAARWLSKDELHSVRWLPADEGLLPVILQEIEKDR